MKTPFISPVREHSGMTLEEHLEMFIPNIPEGGQAYIQLREEDDEEEVTKIVRKVGDAIVTRKSVKELVQERREYLSRRKK